MPVIAAYAVPHPPLLVPAVGKGKELEVTETSMALERIAKEIKAIAPELIVFITPHSVMYADYFHISPSAKAEGDFSNFGADDVKISVDYDEVFVNSLSAEAEKAGIAAGTLGERDNALDQGCTVPLFFLQKHYTDFKTVRIAISDMELIDHYNFGRLISVTATKQDKKTIIIASGDLSHKLSESGPYGFVEDGPVFDALVVDVFKNGTFDKLLDLPELLAENAAECGLRSFVIMAGSLHKKLIKPKLLSYEAPFGVGYAVASFFITGTDESCDYSEMVKIRQSADINDKKAHEGNYVRYARSVVEEYITGGKVPDIPAGLSEEMYEDKAGVFVSIKKTNNLRGCVGTVSPAYANIAEEIRANAISAAVGDSRFMPVTAEELPLLSYSVDVLMDLEPVHDISELDAAKYGIIVRNQFKKGLLLPNLDGVETVEKQINIAKQKAGINPREEFTISRFEVVRHI